uniref:Uncharacterized protein n=1 Tax=Vespula pensylvanica TaxID=30213 RepID=A0A834KL69_VESPE|nr:hypothetical protein H0235_014470 [Vespula pensylvanica]
MKAHITTGSRSRREHIAKVLLLISKGTGGSSRRLERIETSFEGEVVTESTSVAAAGRTAVTASIERIATGSRTSGQAPPPPPPPPPLPPPPLLPLPPPAIVVGNYTTTNGNILETSQQTPSAVASATSSEMVLHMLDTLMTGHEPFYADYPSYQEADPLTHTQHQHTHHPHHHQQQHQQQQQQQQQQDGLHRNAISLNTTTHTPGAALVDLAIKSTKQGQNYTLRRAGDFRP